MRGLLSAIHVERVTFNEITKTAVLEAMNSPRQVSADHFVLHCTYDDKVV